jgi:hypothetical protein
MERTKEDLVTVWGDTVGFRHLLLGISAGAFFSFLASYYGKIYIDAHFSHMQKSLVAGYGLLIGIVVSVAMAVIVGMLCKPKRIFHEQECSVDKESFIKNYNINVEEEAVYVKAAPPEIIRELEQLGLYAVFTGTEAEEV